MIARVSFGGGIETQTVVGLLAILFLGSLAIAYYNIKRLQIEQHRAWMLRAWIYVRLNSLNPKEDFINSNLLGWLDYHMQNHYDFRSLHHLAMGTLL